MEQIYGIAGSITRKSAQVAARNEVLIPVFRHLSVLVNIELAKAQSIYTFRPARGALDASTVHAHGSGTGTAGDNENTLELPPGFPFVIVATKCCSQGGGLAIYRAGPAPNLRDRMTIMQRWQGPLVERAMARRRSPFLDGDVSGFAFLRRVPRSVLRDKATLPDSKTGAKIVHLGDPAIAVLHASLGAVNSSWALSGFDPDIHLVFLRVPRDRILERAAIEDLRIHDLLSQLCAPNG